VTDISIVGTWLGSASLSVSSLDIVLFFFWALVPTMSFDPWGCGYMVRACYDEPCALNPFSCLSIYLHAASGSGCIGNHVMRLIAR
jgi:hypothetical protein